MEIECPKQNTPECHWFCKRCQYKNLIKVIKRKAKIT
jgi:hypothetical protein